MSTKIGKRLEQLCYAQTVCLKSNLRPSSENISEVFDENKSRRKLELPDCKKTPIR